MKKINAAFNSQDRIICVSNHGTQRFFYQPYGTHDRHWLFDADFSGSVFHYFKAHGRNLSGPGFSLTIREFYQYKYSRGDTKLNKLMDRIPGYVEYAIKEEILPTVTPRVQCHYLEADADRAA